MTESSNAPPAGVTRASSQNSAGRLMHVDAMRAFAVLLVVAMHAGITVMPGDGGVTVFFVVSGYIITALLLRERARSSSFDLSGFYWRRMLKLAPPLILIVIIPTLIYSAYQNVSVTAFASQIFFSFNWVQISRPDEAAQVLPGTSVVWSLAVEEQFYIAFSVLWLILTWRKAKTSILAWTAGAVVVTSLGTRVALGLKDAESTHLSHGTDARAEAIAYGVLAALLLQKYSNGGMQWVRRVGSAWWLVGAVGLFWGSSLVFNGGWAEPVLRPTFQGVASVVFLVSGLVASEARLVRTYYRCISPRLVQLVGLASYSIYLCHFPLIKLLDDLTNGLDRPLQVLANVAAGVGIGIVIYLVLEVPVQRFKNAVGARSLRSAR